MERLRLTGDIANGIQSAKAASPGAWLRLYLTEQAEKQLRAETDHHEPLYNRSNFMNVPIRRAADEQEAEWAIYCGETGHLLAVAPAKPRRWPAIMVLAVAFIYVVGLLVAAVLRYY